MLLRITIYIKEKVFCEREFSGKFYWILIGDFRFVSQFFSNLNNSYNTIVV